MSQSRTSSDSLPFVSSISLSIAALNRTGSGEEREKKQEAGIIQALRKLPNYSEKEKNFPELIKKCKANKYLTQTLIPQVNKLDKLKSAIQACLKEINKLKLEEKVSEAKAGKKDKKPPKSPETIREEDCKRIEGAYASIEKNLLLLLSSEVADKELSEKEEEELNTARKSVWYNAGKFKCLEKYNVKLPLEITSVSQGLDVISTTVPHRAKAAADPTQPTPKNKTVVCYDAIFSACSLILTLSERPSPLHIEQKEEKEEPSLTEHIKKSIVTLIQRDATKEEETKILAALREHENEIKQSFKKTEITLPDQGFDCKLTGDSLGFLGKETREAKENAATFLSCFYKKYEKDVLKDNARRAKSGTTTPRCITFVPLTIKAQAFCLISVSSSEDDPEGLIKKMEEMAYYGEMSKQKTTYLVAKHLSENYKKLIASLTKFSKSVGDADKYNFNRSCTENHYLNLIAKFRAMCGDDMEVTGIVNCRLFPFKASLKKHYPKDCKQGNSAVKRIRDTSTEDQTQLEKILTNIHDVIHLDDVGGTVEAARNILGKPEDDLLFEFIKLCQNCQHEKRAVLTHFLFLSVLNKIIVRIFGNADLFNQGIPSPVKDEPLKIFRQGRSALQHERKLAEQEKIARKAKKSTYTSTMFSKRKPVDDYADTINELYVSSLSLER